MTFESPLMRLMGLVSLPSAIVAQMGMTLSDAAATGQK